MRFIRGLLDRVVLIAGVLAGGIAPSFVAQYRQRVGGRLDQARIDLAPFQEIANRFHQGSLDALVQHHLRSVDQTFHREGEAIKALMDSVLHLQVVVDGLHGSLAHQAWFLLRNYDPNTLRATWDIYQPAFSFSIDALVFAGLVGIALWGTFLAIWITAAATIGLLAGRLTRAAS
jgi:hypothetical protein